MLEWLRRLCGGWVGEINIKSKLSPAELKLVLSLAIQLISAKAETEAWMSLAKIN